MERITINVEVKQQGKSTSFVLATNGKEVANIMPDYMNKGKWSGRYDGHGACNNTTYPEAVEFVTSGIERIFEQYGIDVQFV